MIKTGEKLPDVKLYTPSADGPQEVTTGALFAGKKAVLFGVPGAFTPTCHQNHLPGYLNNLDALKAKGVELVACVTVNDIFVTGKWAEATGAAGKITLLADGSGALSKAAGLELDLSAFGLGMRQQRFAMILEDGVVAALMVENTPQTADASGAEAVLNAL